MVNTIEVRKVTQDVLLFVWFKQKALPEEPPRESGLIPEVSDNLMTNLSVSIWIESYRTQFIWDEFFKKHFKRMTSSSKLFANYVAYACYVLNKSNNAYECFFDILSIVSEFSLRCLEGDRVEYVNTCVELFCTFFEKEIYQKFEDLGGWEKFNEYIRNHYNSIDSKSLICDNKSPVILFEYFPNALEKSNQPGYVIGRVLKKRKQPYYEVNGVVLKDITQTHVETHEKAVSFAISVHYALKWLLKKTFDGLIIDFKNTYCQVKSVYKYADEDTFNGFKRKEEEWNLNLSKPKKKHVELSSKGNQQSSVEIKNNGIERKKDKESSGEMNKQRKKDPSHKVQKCPIGMQCNGVQRKKDESSCGIKSQRKQCSLLKVPPSGMESKGVQQKINESSNGMEKKGKQRSSHEGGTPGGMESKGMQKKINQPSKGTEKQGKQRSSHEGGTPGGMESKGVEKKINQSPNGMDKQGKHHSMHEGGAPCGIQSKGVQQKINQSSSVMEQGKQCSSHEGRTSNSMQSNRVQQKNEQESSNGLKNKIEHSSQNVNETSENASYKTKAKEKEPEGIKTIDPDPLESRNFQKYSVPVQASHLKLKMETAKKLLREMSLAIAKISVLIQSLCEKYGLRIPVQLQANTKVQNF